MTEQRSTTSIDAAAAVSAAPETENESAGTTRDRTRWTNTRVWFVAFALASVLGGLWAFMSPMMTSPDEPSQTVRSIAVVRGERGDEQAIMQSDESVQNVVVTRVQVPRAYADLELSTSCITFKPLQSANCIPPMGDDMTPALAATYVGRYPPLYHLIVGVPSLVLAPASALVSMRVLSAILSAVFIGIAVVAARELDRRRLVIVALAVCITPEVVFLSASINPSGLEMASGIALWLTTTVLVRSSGRPDRGAVARFALTAAVFTWTRPLSPAYLVVIVVAVWFLFGSRLKARDLLAKGPFRVGFGVAAVAWLGSMAWLLSTKSFSAVAGYPRTSATNAELLHDSLNLLPAQSRQLIAVFGWLDTDLTPWAIALAFVGLGVIIALGLVLGRNRERAGIILIGVGSIGFTLVAEVNGARMVGMGWQGRYSFALIVGAPLMAAVVADASPRLSMRVTRAFAVVAIACVGLIQLVAAFTEVRRYAVGIDHPLLSYLSDAAWSPVGNHLWLFTGTCLAVAAISIGWLGLVRGSTLAASPRASAPEEIIEVPDLLA